MFGRPLLGICVWLAAFGVVSALAMYCPTSDYDQVEKLVTDLRPATPRCDCSWRASSAQAATSALHDRHKECEADFLASLGDRARRSYNRAAKDSQAEAARCSNPSERFTRRSSPIAMPSRLQKPRSNSKAAIAAVNPA
jgi:hypothetical protein